ncbi:MAG: hypothetical protein V2I67_06585, partial [Thermoanaerobaculales bacterium]|jgi:hypothetical protein|nr:hypothetical protein [Thermoanaerobaculales bacterium]
LVVLAPADVADKPSVVDDDFLKAEFDGQAFGGLPADVGLRIAFRSLQQLWSFSNEVVAHVYGKYWVGGVDPALTTVNSPGPG